MPIHWNTLSKIRPHQKFLIFKMKNLVQTDFSYIFLNLQHVQFFGFVTLLSHDIRCICGSSILFISEDKEWGRSSFEQKPATTSQLHPYVSKLEHYKALKLKYLQVINFTSPIDLSDEPLLLSSMILIHMLFLPATSASQSSFFFQTNISHLCTKLKPYAYYCMSLQTSKPKPLILCRVPG